MNQTVIKCPTCGKPVRWVAEERWRPFCSERCRLIDLGAWADGSHAIPAEPAEFTQLQVQDEDGVAH